MTIPRHEKQRSRLKIAIVLNLVIFAILGLGFGREYLRNREIEQEIARMESENARLEADRLAAVNLINDLSSTYYLEGEARTKRGMGESGETMIIVKNDAASAENGGDAHEETNDADAPNPLHWLYYFFDHPRFEAMRVNDGAAL